MGKGEHPVHGAHLPPVRVLLLVHTISLLQAQVEPLERFQRVEHMAKHPARRLRRIAGGRRAVHRADGRVIIIGRGNYSRIQADKVRGAVLQIFREPAPVDQKKQRRAAPHEDPEGIGVHEPHHKAGKAGLFPAADHERLLPRKGGGAHEFPFGGRPDVIDLQDIICVTLCGAAQRLIFPIRKADLRHRAGEPPQLFPRSRGIGRDQSKLHRVTPILY